METWNNTANINRESGFMATMQRMMGKLSDIVAQKSSRNSSPPIELAIDSVQLWSENDSPTNVWQDEKERQRECNQLARLIERALSEAKDGPLGCGEVLLPAELTLRVARDVVTLAEDEPCGLRGCVLLVHYVENEMSDARSGKSSIRQIGSVRVEPDTVATFELVLTLRKDLNTWTNLRHMLPFKACLRKLGTKCNTIIVSPVYNLVKRKLYRSSGYE